MPIDNIHHICMLLYCIVFKVLIKSQDLDLIINTFQGRTNGKEINCADNEHVEISSQLKSLGNKILTLNQSKNRIRTKRRRKKKNQLGFLGTKFPAHSSYLSSGKQAMDKYV